ncbi:hypothetical protein ACK3F5_01695 [Photorhabdus asymbiotica UENP]
MTGVSECSQQRGNLKDNGYIHNTFIPTELQWGFPDSKTDCSPKIKMLDVSMNKDNRVMP